MSRLTATVIALTLLFGFVSCNGKQEPAPSQDSAVESAPPENTTPVDPADKEYTVRLEPTPKVGTVVEWTTEDSMEQTIGMSLGGQSLNTQANKMGHQLSGHSKVLEVSGDEVIRQEVYFDKATKDSEQGPQACNVQGKKVIYSKVGDSHEFAFEDGTAVSVEDRGLVEKAIGKKDDSGMAAADVFAPKKPVKVGDTWQPSVEEIVSDFDMEGSGVTIDVERSTAEFRLVSAEPREHGDYGKVQGEITLLASAFGPMKPTKPIPMRFEVTIEAYLDGGSPVGEMMMKMTAKADTGIDMDGAPEGMTMNFDMTMEMTKTQALKKE